MSLRAVAGGGGGGGTSNALEQRTSDLTANAANSGRIWTRTDTGDTKMITERVSSPAGSWSAGGAIATATRYLAAFGTASDAVMAGGLITGTNSVSTSEEYNGSTYSAGNSQVAARRQASGSSQSKSTGFIAGGLDVSATNLASSEEFDGTNYSAGGNLSTARYESPSVGDSSDAKIISGTTGTFTTSVEDYEGEFYLSYSSRA